MQGLHLGADGLQQELLHKETEATKLKHAADPTIHLLQVCPALYGLAYGQQSSQGCCGANSELHSCRAQCYVWPFGLSDDIQGVEPVPELLTYNETLALPVDGFKCPLV